MSAVSGRSNLDGCFRDFTQGVGASSNERDGTHTTKTAGCWPTLVRRWISTVGNIASIRSESPAQTSSLVERREQTRIRGDEGNAQGKPERAGCNQVGRGEYGPKKGYSQIKTRKLIWKTFASHFNCRGCTSSSKPQLVGCRR
jgi:hypothetical protein